jgi:hypothetical protein
MYFTAFYLLYLYLTDNRWGYIFSIASLVRSPPPVQWLMRGVVCRGTSRSDVYGAHECLLSHCGPRTPFCHLLSYECCGIGRGLPHTERSVLRRHAR